MTGNHPKAPMEEHQNRQGPIIKTIRALKHQYCINITASSKSLIVALFRMICSLLWRDRPQYHLQGYWEECSICLADNITQIDSMLDSWSDLTWVPVAWLCGMICGESDSMTLDEVDRIIWAVSLASCFFRSKSLWLRPSEK